MHSLTSTINSKGDVRSRDGKVLKSSYRATIESRIN